MLKTVLEIARVVDYEINLVQVLNGFRSTILTTSYIEAPKVVVNDSLTKNGIIVNVNELTFRCDEIIRM